jgi:hypothetical protein
MRKRSTSLSAVRVSPETAKAMQEVYAALNMGPTEFRIRSAAAFAGNVQTSLGTLADVVAREMQR